MQEISDTFVRNSLQFIEKNTRHIWVPFQKECHGKLSITYRTKCKHCDIVSHLFIDSNARVIYLDRSKIYAAEGEFAPDKIRVSRELCPRLQVMK